MKSGEELRELFTSPNALFIGVCEGRVKSEEYLAKFSAATFCCMILLLDTAARYCCYTLSQHSFAALFLPLFWMRLQKYSISKAIPTFPHNPATLFLQMGKKEKPTGKGMGKKKNTRGKKKNNRENIEKSEKITSFILPKHQISKNIRTFAEYKRDYQT